ncbi:substrate-binding and VWA domain-containing protein [Streptomyces sp. RK62]|uniref:substrate-binding and VWA domain-containing protein n=1 Tax=Streptomyces sp. RK62 TaxID=2824893 RepID=UPI001B376D64|nr:substrate-binding and VWA domain-containing protein [Streptomyces sp. RK62]MBQ1001120.1 VWA domain-containing protein [Streptomyces sp. RK62]
MGRHSLPDQYGAGSGDPGRRAFRRRLALVTAVALTVAGGTAAAVGEGLLTFGTSCQDDAVRLTLAASPEVAPALKTAAERARRAGLTSDGRCVAVTVTAREPHRIAEALSADEDPGAEVWVPDSQAWVQRLTADGGTAEVSTIGNVAASPVGVAMVPAAAKKLGWPRRTYTWTELAGETLGDGPVRLGAGDPSRSAAGLLALTRVSAAADATEGGDTRAAALMKALSERVTEGDGQILESLPRDASDSESANPRRNQAVVLSEQAAFTYNAATEDARDLDFFYPQDGAPRLDYPYALLDQTGLTTDESRAAIRFMSYLDDPEQQRLLERYGFRTSDEKVPDGLVARAGGSAPQPYAAPVDRPVTAVALQEALGVWEITVRSARITMVVDASASMEERVPGTERSRMDVTRASLRRALNTFTADDEIGLWDFSTALDGAKDYRVRVPAGRLGDSEGDVTQRDRLAAAVDRLKPVPDGATGLYDTTLAAYEAARSSYAKGRFNAVVVLTDGVNEDPGSISRAALLSRLGKLADSKRPLPLIMIAVGPDADREEADRIAKATGGSGHEVTDPAQMETAILKAIVKAASPDRRG